MNKLAKYLNQHLMGEVYTDDTTLTSYSTDGSPLILRPEMVVYPRETNDIRKLMKFSWQLAKKGHKLSVTARGAGNDVTGAAIGSGAVIEFQRHMNRIFEADLKQRLVRLQPGVSFGALRSALRLNGLDLPRFAPREASMTVGGAVAGTRGRRVYDLIDRLEVVLANGDMIQTKRLSKRDLNKLKGLQTFEADIYRSIDALIDDNKELVDTIDEKSAAGYSSIAQVKRKDGSIDLTPLFIGSQGSLGIISELIIKTDHASAHTSAVLGCFPEIAAARDALDAIDRLAPSRVEWYDRASMEQAQSVGKTYSWMENAADTCVTVVAYFDDTGDRARLKKIKKLAKLFEKIGARTVEAEDIQRSELTNLEAIHALRDDNDLRPVTMLEGIHVPLDRFESFVRAVEDLATKRRVALSLSGEPLREVWSITPVLNLKSVGGKQNVVKLVKDVAEIASAHGGYLAAAYAEGRLQSFATSNAEDAEVSDLFSAIKHIFDPDDVLNTGVKSSSSVKDLIRMIRND